MQNSSSFLNHQNFYKDINMEKNFKITSKKTLQEWNIM